MFYRGLFALLINLSFAFYKRARIIPADWKKQTLRLLVDGSSIWLLYQSFKYLSAASVSLIQRMDIPALIILSVLRKENKSSLQFWLSFWTILLIGFFVLDSRFIDEEPIGFVYAISSVMLLATTFFLIKKQTTTESIFVLGNTFALGLIFFGAIISSFNHSSFIIQGNDIWIFLLTGIMQFVIVNAALKLFQWYTAERARLPFVIGVFMTMILEMILEKKFFSLNQIGLTVLIAGIIVTICLNPNTPTKKNNTLP